jgi:hypothetical protein
MRLAVVALVISSAFLLPSTAGSRALSGPCALARRDGETVQHYAIRRIRCAVTRFGPVPGGSVRAVCIARRESGLYPKASSATGMYVGLYQHLASAWKQRFATWTKAWWGLPTSAFSGRSNAIVTIRMVHSAGGWKTAGWPVRGC